MDQQTSTASAQSSIRSFFQPLLATQPTKQQIQQQPRPTAQSLPFTLATPKSVQPPSLSSPPPPKPSSSYATPPSLQSQTPASSLQSSSPLPKQSTTSSSASLPQEARILPIHRDHIVALRRINSLLLPISYPDSFYHAILAPSEPAQTNFSRVITWEGKVIGGIVCRLDQSLPSAPSPFTTSPHTVDRQSGATAHRVEDGREKEYDIYIQSLCLLSPYRSKGLITSAFEDILLAATIEAKISNLKIKGLYAHVWTSNEEALQWYRHRSFSVYEGGMVQGYYRRLKPDTAYILRRELSVSDHLLNKVDHHLSSKTPLPKIMASPTNGAKTPPPPPANTPAPLPPTSDGAVRPHGPSPSRSFQERGPEREWNDLPEEMTGLGGRGLLSVPGSGASSRSSSQARASAGAGTGDKKKRRAYPAAAFKGPA